MSWTRRFLTVLGRFLVGWGASLKEFIRLLSVLRRRSRNSPPTRVRRQPQCVPIDHPAFRKPDPLIYDQYHLISQGIAVTWDNPDIEIRKDGVGVPPGTLSPDAEYEVRVRVWNASTDAWVVQMPVHLSYLDFGIGTVAVPVATQYVSVGVQGAASQPGFVSFPWRTPELPGHYCLQALLDPADDSNFANNLGQKNINVAVAHSPAAFEFKLENRTRRTHRYRFLTDAYEIPPMEPCPPDNERQDPGVAANLRRRRLAVHNVDGYPVPDSWKVEITPEHPALAPGDQVGVTAVITPPDAWTGKQSLNVHAYDEHNAVAGGVTLIVVRNSTP